MIEIKGKLDAALQTFQRNLTSDAEASWKIRDPKLFAGDDLPGTACTAILTAMTPSNDPTSIISTRWEKLTYDWTAGLTVLLPPSREGQANS